MTHKTRVLVQNNPHVGSRYGCVWVTKVTHCEGGIFNIGNVYHMHPSPKLLRCLFHRMSAATIDQHSTTKCTVAHGSVAPGTSKTLNLYTSLPS